jgi:cytoskeleton protein RodZ
MKSVGKQMQEARLAKSWTPELAARETKIKVDRLRDLEADDYSHFTSPTYARGFVRTYARALGLDEYRILRQLDNKLPDDDSANIVTDTGVAYLPETSLPTRAAHRDYTGLYITMGLGAVVTLAIVFVLFEAYRVGELSRWFGSGGDTIVATTSSTNGAPDEPMRAKPVDSDTPPPIADATNQTNGTNTVATAVPPQALPVDVAVPAAGNATNAAPVVADAAPTAPKALPVDAADLTNAAPAETKTAPRALPVDLSDLTNSAAAAPAPMQGTLVVANTVPPPADIPTEVHTSSSARASNSGPVVQSAAASAPVAATIDPAAPTAAPVATPVSDDKRLVLTASQDSFVRVTNLDASDGDKPLYAAVLHSGQSVGFDGRKFSINVGIPSAVDIKLDGVNYGPHSDQAAPETFTVQSHLP